MVKVLPSAESESLSLEFNVVSCPSRENVVLLVSSRVLPSLDNVALRTNFAGPISPDVSLPSRL